MRGTRWSILGLIMAAAAATGGLAQAPGRGVGAGANWPSINGAPDESSFSQLKQVTAANVGRLGLAWSLDLPGEASLEATPVAVDGVLYFTGSTAIVYAVDATSGRLLWKYDPETWKHHPEKLNFAVYPVNRGVAYDNGRIFGAAIDGRLFALDAKTGRELWVAETTAPNSVQTSTGAPRTFDGMVIIGQGGADIGGRGYVTAYDQATGKQIWRFYTVPGSPEQNRGDPAMERAAATWNGEYWKTGTGGTVWSGITFDPELKRIYIGTSNGGPFDPQVRSPGGGDNLYLASIVALDAATGKYLWHYQVNPREGWDYKATADMIVAHLTIGGRPRRVLMQAPTNGFFYVLDRDTGKLISAEKIGKVTWAERIDLGTGRPVEAPNIRYETGESVLWPSSIGAHNWQPMSYDPATGLVYIPYMQLGVRFSRGAPQPGANHAGGLSMRFEAVDPADGKGALLAWDPVKQVKRWSAPHETLWNGGTLATAGGVVFQGAADGYLSAYDAASGRTLWRFNAGHGIIGAPSTYTAKGRQYVSILVGYGGSAAAMSDFMNVGWKYSNPRRLLTFELNAKAQLPPTPPPSLAVIPLDDPTLTFDAHDVEAGRNLYMRCMGCHGRDLVAAGGPAPDLRESPVALDREAFWTVLHEGALMERGMPRYASLTREQAMQIYAYIRAGARLQLSGRGQAAEAGPR